MHVQSLISQKQRKGEWILSFEDLASDSGLTWRTFEYNPNNKIVFEEHVLKKILSAS